MLVHTGEKRAVCMLMRSEFYLLLQVSRLSKCKSSCDQVQKREKLKMTYPPVLLVKGSLIEESTCTMKARYIGCPNKSARFKVCAIVDLLGWRR